MILGTRDWEGKGMLGDELEDLRLDLSGFRVLASEGECKGEVQGKGTTLKEFWDKSCVSESSSSS